MCKYDLSVGPKYDLHKYDLSVNPQVVLLTWKIDKW